MFINTGKTEVVAAHPLDVDLVRVAQPAGPVEARARAVPGVRLGARPCPAGVRRFRSWANCRCGQTASPKDWKHALSVDMIHLFNDYYFETYTDAFGEPSVELHHSNCDALIYSVPAPEVAAVSVWLTNIWDHHQVCTA